MLWGIRRGNGAPMQPATVIRRASWAVAWDDESDDHVYLRDADVVFSEEGVIQVGGHYDGPVGEEIDGRDLMAMPGLVNIHSHPTSEPMNKGVTDEIRSPNFHNSSLYEFLPVLGPDAEGARACLNVALAELLTSGCTTVVDYSRPIEGWLDLLGQSGVRACIAPSFRSAPWSTPDGHSLSYDWSLATRSSGAMAVPRSSGSTASGC